jgi:hypothetical protein
MTARDRFAGFLFESELVELLKDRREGRGLREFAKLVEVASFQHLGQVLQGVKPPGKRIPQVLGYEPVTVYRPILSVEKKKEGKR